MVMMRSSALSEIENKIKSAERSRVRFLTSGFLFWRQEREQFSHHCIG